MTATPYGLGHILVEDPRDKLYPLSAILPERPFITQKMWWDNGWWGNQGQSSECTCYSWLHWLSDGPLLQNGIEDHPTPLFNPSILYYHAQRNDGIPGPPPPYDGSTIRAVAKIFKEIGAINEYRWAANTDDITTALLTIGPVVAGTSWYNGMFTPDEQGLVQLNGGIAGGHAYVLNGVDLDKGVYRIKNSWGQNWGINGHCYIRISDFEMLLQNSGQVCMALANKMSVLPDLSKLTDDDVA